MRWCLMGLMLIASFEWTPARADDPTENESTAVLPQEKEGSADGSDVAVDLQRFLDEGDLANAELEFSANLDLSPNDDQARFALGMVRLARAVERLGQSLHRYGIRSELAGSPILRLPVPRNTDPASINYASFSRMFDEFSRDLELAESTLKQIESDEVILPLKLSSIMLDLTSDGDPSERFGDLLIGVMRGEPQFLKDNPEFIVHFDRGDVAWVRAYCHLLMSIVDFYLAFDTESEFGRMASRQFPKVVVDEEAEVKAVSYPIAFPVVQPRRLGRARRHLIQVAKLNHETWKHIRAEKDDEYEWLPNATQKQGVLGLPVQDAMIDAWLAMVDEFEALLEGERAFLKAFWGKEGKGVNLKVLLEDPPKTMVSDPDFLRSLPDRYYTDAEDINTGVVLRVFFMLQNTTGVGYAAWFN